MHFGSNSGKIIKALLSHQHLISFLAEKLEVTQPPASLELERGDYLHWWLSIICWGSKEMDTEAMQHLSPAPPQHLLSKPHPHFGFLRPCCSSEDAKHLQPGLLLEIFLYLLV